MGDLWFLCGLLSQINKIYSFLQTWHERSIKKEFIQIYMGSTFSPLPFIPTLPIINFLEILQALP